MYVGVVSGGKKKDGPEKGYVCHSLRELLEGTWMPDQKSHQKDSTATSWGMVNRICAKRKKKGKGKQGYNDTKKVS